MPNGSRATAASARLMLASSMRRLCAWASPRHATASATNTPNSSTAVNGTTRNCSGGSGTPMKPPGRRAAMSAPTMPSTTMTTASAAPHVPRRRCNARLPPATSSGWTASSTNQAAKNTPWTRKNGLRRRQVLMLREPWLEEEGAREADNDRRQQEHAHPGVEETAPPIRGSAARSPVTCRPRIVARRQRDRRRSRGEEEESASDRPTKPMRDAAIGQIPISLKTSFAERKLSIAAGTPQ